MLIQDYFDINSKKTPHKIALLSDNSSLTYSELSEKSIKLANLLLNLGVTSGDFIGILMPNSVDAIIAMLSILRIGAAYVPLDKNLPSVRLSNMIRNCAITVCITNNESVLQELEQHLFYGIHWINFMTVRFDTLPSKLTTLDASNINERMVAYINFTSGSTGEPKGVACSHEAVIRLFTRQNYLNFSQEQIFLHAAPIYFDAAVFEIWGALITGQTCVVNENKLLIPIRLEELIKKFQLTTMWLTSSLFDVFANIHIKCFEGIKFLLVGGDVVNPNSVRKLYDNNKEICIINGYGPTENTTFSCCYIIPRVNIDKLKTIPIGYPVRETEILILNSDDQQTTDGELYVAGTGLANGYVKGGKLFDDKTFLMIQNKRYYKTGDMVRLNHKGALEFLGRVDNQVKIAGYRIELEEVESIAKTIADVIQACAIAHSDNYGSKVLLLFISTGYEKNKKDITNKLFQILPKHMQPNEIIFKKTLTLKETGKINKNTLIEDYIKDVDTGFSNLDDENHEQVVCSVWKQTLYTTKRIENTSNFFELGGTSLMALQCAGMINKLLNCAIPMDAIFIYPKYSDFIRYISTFVFFNQTTVPIVSRISINLDFLIII